MSPENKRAVPRIDGQMLSDLWVFRAAASSESITTAAVALNVTQSAVSQRILRLEARIGAPLFVRQKNRILLTDAGTSLLEAMNQVSLVLSDGMSRIRRSQQKAIVVSCVPSLATEWLVQHLDDFYSVHPGTEVFVRSEMATLTPAHLDNEDIDLIINYQPVPVVDLHELASVQEFVFPVCSPRYRDMLAAADDESTPLVLLNDDMPWWGGSAESEWLAWRRESACAWPAGPSSSRHFNLAHLAYHAAMLDQGVAIGRAVIVNRLLSKGDLIAAVDVPPVKGSTYRILTNRPGGADSPVRQFANWWREAMLETQAHTLSLFPDSGSRD